MRKYEIMFVVRPDLDDEGRKKVIENFTNILKDNNAEIVKVDDWGLKQLAYEIRDFRKGHYVVVNVVAPITAVNEFDRLARISEDVIRYLIVKEE